MSSLGSDQHFSRTSYDTELIKRRNYNSDAVKSRNYNSDAGKSRPYKAVKSGNYQNINLRNHGVTNPRVYHASKSLNPKNIDSPNTNSRNYDTPKTPKRHSYDRKSLNSRYHDDRQVCIIVIISCILQL